MICLPVMEPHQQPLATLQITVTGKNIRDRSIQTRDGVKLEFVPNLFDLIRKFAIRLIQGEKNIRKIR